MVIEKTDFATKERLDELDQEFSESDYPWVVFTVNSTEYGINSKHVISIENLGMITPVHGTQSYCPGITESRGEIIDLVDLRALFGALDHVPAKLDGRNSHNMMMVIETGDKKRGVIVDEIVSVEYITEFIDGIVGNGKCSITSQYIHQIARREKKGFPILIIDPDNLDVL
jgi:purine-binding chemotaxis protein CheW